MKRWIVSAVLGVMIAMGAHANALYYGGPIVSHPRVVVVYWGPNVSAVTKTNMPLFLTDILSSDYWSLLGEYPTAGVTPVGGGASTGQPMGLGTVQSSVTITPSMCATTPPSCQLTEAQIRSELAAQIAAGHLPTPTNDALGFDETVYMLYFPLNVGITMTSGAQSCMQFCALWLDLTIGTATAPVGLFPDLSNSGCSGGCGSGTVLQNTTQVCSVVLQGIVTTPQLPSAATYAPPLAWFDRTNNVHLSLECNGMVGSTTIGANTWSVTKVWSESQRRCLLANALFRDSYE